MLNYQTTNKIESQESKKIIAPLKVLQKEEFRKEIVMSVRVNEHIILGDQEEAKMVTITVDGQPMQAREGEMILSALLAEGKIISRYTTKRHEPRGLFCGIGQCTDCAMIVNGRPNVRTCITPVKEGMVIQTQYGFTGKEAAK